METLVVSKAKDVEDSEFEPSTLMVAIFSATGTLILAAIALMIYCCCAKSKEAAKVHQDIDKEVLTNRGEEVSSSMSKPVEGYNISDSDVSEI